MGRESSLTGQRYLFPGRLPAWKSLLLPAWLVVAAGAAFPAQRTAARPGPVLEPYVVQQGDTLYSLARERATSVKAIMTANRMSGSRLRAGAVLRLPAAPAASSSDSSPDMAAAILLPGDPTGALSVVGGASEDQPNLRTRLVESAKTLLGIRYRRSGSSEKNGFDCSGLVQTVFRRFGIELPRSSRQQYREGLEIQRGQLLAGDLVFFSRARRKTVPDHVAIYIGESLILHSLSGARKVVITSTDSAWFRRTFMGARRMPELWLDETFIADSGARQ